MTFTINGIDIARADALREAGIDPNGPMDQFATVLGTKWVYCNQHLGIHPTDGSCTVDAFEKFPLTTTGERDDALVECREQGFRLYRDPAPCKHCGQLVHQRDYFWATVEGNETRCSDRTPTAYGSGHEPVESVPVARIAVV